MTHDRIKLYDFRSPPPGLGTITIGDRRELNIECVGNVDAIFHGFTDERIMLIDASYIPGLDINL